MAEYSFFDRLLHRLALGSKAIAEMSFDIDQAQARGADLPPATGGHIFIAGLARAGTTILMRKFYESGAFRSLTYRDMPFVLAPNMWKKLSGASKKQIAMQERAHGDGIAVDADSPEALEEVFWRIFTGDEYLHADRLVPHLADEETLDKFRDYIRAILVSGENGAGRYLSKNNNNILRLPSIRSAFPDALLLIPVRHPGAHVASLMKMHERFTADQTDDSFVRAYMRWLAHHEFGLDHRPFIFDGARPAGSPDQAGYWLSLWLNCYAWLEANAPADAIFVCYEDLCGDPGIWQTLADKAGIDPGPGETGFQIAAAPAAHADPALSDGQQAEAAITLYQRLRARGIASGA